MKALLITPIFPPQKGGGAEDFYEIAKIMKSIGVKDITVISHSIKGERVEEIYKGFLVKRIIKTHGSIEKISFETSKHIKKEIKKEKYEIVILHSNIFPNRRLYSDVFKDFKGRLILFKSDLVPLYDYSIFDKIISISEGIYKFLLKDGANNEQIVKLPILFKKPSLPKNYKRPIKDKYLFFPGGINQLKGAYELFKAFRLLKKEIKFPLKLIVAGVSSIYADFHKDIIFLGAVERKELINCAYGSEIVVLPSYTEGLPRTILEAISIGKPVLFTKWLVPEFDFLDERYLLDKVEPNEIKNRIKSILSENKKPNYKPIENIIGSKDPKKEWKQYLKNLLNLEKEPTSKRKVKNIKKEDKTDFSSEKFWGKEKNALLLDILKTFKKKQIHLPLSYTMSMVNNLNFKDSELFFNIANIYYSLNMKEYAKQFYIKGLKFYPQQTAFLSFYKLILNFKLSKEENKEIINFLSIVKEDCSESRLFDFIVENSMDLLNEEFERFFFFDETFIKNKIKEYLTQNKPNMIRNFIIINTITKGKRNKEVLKNALLYFEGLKGKVCFDYYNMALLYKETLKDYYKAYIYFKKHIRCKSNKIHYKIYFYLGDTAKELKKKNRGSYYKKGVEILKKKKNKTFSDLYRLASFYKRINDFKNAKKWFNKLLKNDCDLNLKSGAYFHLGEIELEKGNTKKALSYFKKCLEFNPLHRKAKEYMEEYNENCIH